MPPTYYAFVYMVLDALLYGVLAWYLDAVLRGNLYIHTHTHTHTHQFDDPWVCSCIPQETMESLGNCKFCCVCGCVLIHYSLYHNPPCPFLHRTITTPLSSPHPFFRYFFLLPSYWFGSSRSGSAPCAPPLAKDDDDDMLVLNGPKVTVLIR